jgi:glutamate racemase
LIEAGELDTPATETLLRGWLQPMLDAGMDELVLGCTHYPFVMPLIRRIVGDQVEVIDPTPAVARQVQRILEQRQELNMDQQYGQLIYQTSGNAEIFGKTLKHLTGITAPIQTLKWDHNESQLHLSGSFVA